MFNYMTPKQQVSIGMIYPDPDLEERPYLPVGYCEHL